MQSRNLEAGEFIELLWVWLKKPQYPPFPQRNELSVGQDAGATAKNCRSWCAMWRPAFVPLPHEFAGLKFDTTKAGIGLIASAEGVEKTVQKNRCTPMHFKDRAAPERFDSFAVGFNAQ